MCNNLKVVIFVYVCVCLSVSVIDQVPLKRNAVKGRVPAPNFKQD